MRIKTIDVSDEAADVLRRGEWEGTLFRLPAGQLDRKLYEAVDKVLGALGGKWNRSMRGHLFTMEAQADLRAALESGSIVDQKRTLEQFFTPLDLAQRMVRELDIGPGDNVLEPSAGGGNLVAAALEMGAIVQPIELDATLAGGLHRAMQAHFGDRPTPGVLRPVIQADFLSVPALSITPDKALMNPPFSGNQDIAHVRHAFDMLAPGGRLAAIMSPHFTFADDRPSREFRELIGYPTLPRSAKISLDPPADPVASASVQLLPAGTFKESGTGVSSVLVLIEKAA